MADLSSYSDAELLAIYGKPAKAKAAPAKKETGFFEGGGRAITRRGVGLIQGAMELAGQTDNDIYRASLEAAKNLANESKDTGFVDTLGEVLGDPLNAVAAPFAVGKGALSLAGIGAAFGGLEGVSRPIAEGESRAVNTAVGAGTGAIAAPAIGYLGGKAGQVGDFLVDKGSQAVNAIKQAFGNVGADDLIGLEVSAGSAYDDIAQAVKSMSEDAVSLFKEGINVGLSPRQAYIAAKAKDKGVTLTKGMLTQDAASQRLEDYAAQGLLNDKARKAAVDTAQSNQDAVGGWASQLLSDVSGAGGAGVDETTVANAVGQAVKGKAAQLKAPATAAFEAGAKTQAKVPASEFSNFHNTIKKELVSDGFDVGAMPTLNRNLATIRKAEKLFTGKDVKYAPLEVFRKRLYQGINAASDPSEKAAMGRLYGAYTTKLENIITSGALKNPDEAAKQLRAAPALWKEYKQTIFGQDGKAALGKIVEKDMTDRQIADLFGSSIAGKGDTEKVVRQLRNVLGEDSPEYGQVRGMFLNRLFKGALTEGDSIGKKGFGVALNTQWRNAQTKNKALMDELFTPDMQREITDFVATNYLMNARNASKVNPSGSGIVAMDGIVNLINRVGGGSIAAELAKGAGKALAVRGNSKDAVKALYEPLKALGSDSRIISDALRAVGAVTGIQTNRIASDATAPNAPVAEQPAENPLQGMTDEELLQMYQQETPATPEIPIAPLPGKQSMDFTQGNEGLRHAAYIDTTGNRTVGFGFNMDSGIAKRVWKRAKIATDYDKVYNGKAAINDLEARALYAASKQIAIDDATSIYPNIHKLSKSRQEALLDLSYQLGKPSLSKFTEFNAAVKRGDWVNAIRSLRKTKYWQQTPNRAAEVARRLTRADI